MKKNDFLTLDDVKSMIAAQMTEEMLLDTLGLDIFELVELLENEITEKWDDVIAQLYE